MGPRGRLLGSIRVSIIPSFIRSRDAVVRSRLRGAAPTTPSAQISSRRIA
jgi:hypothetical protein